MYLGLPLFPGVSQHNQLSRIVEMLGQPPDSLIEGKNGFKYFTKVNYEKNNEKISDKVPSSSISNLLPVSSSASKYRLKTPEEYAAETKTEIPVLRKYLRYSRLEDVILKCPLANKSKLSPEQKKDEMNRRMCFLDFLKVLTVTNPHLTTYLLTHLTTFLLTHLTTYLLTHLTTYLLTQGFVPLEPLAPLDGEAGSVPPIHHQYCLHWTIYSAFRSPN
jgi:hypothetical protein